MAMRPVGARSRSPLPPGSAASHPPPATGGIGRIGDSRSAAENHAEHMRGGGRSESVSGPATTAGSRHRSPGPYPSAPWSGSTRPAILTGGRQGPPATARSLAPPVIVSDIGRILLEGVDFLEPTVQRRLGGLDRGSQPHAEQDARSHPQDVADHRSPFP